MHIYQSKSHTNYFSFTHIFLLGFSLVIFSIVGSHSTYAQEQDQAHKAGDWYLGLDSGIGIELLRNVRGSWQLPPTTAQNIVSPGVDLGYNAFSLYVNPASLSSEIYMNSYSSWMIHTGAEIHVVGVSHPLTDLAVMIAYWKIASGFRAYLDDELPLFLEIGGAASFPLTNPMVGTTSFGKSYFIAGPYGAFGISYKISPRVKLELGSEFYLVLLDLTKETDAASLIRINASPMQVFAGMKFAL